MNPSLTSETGTSSGSLKPAVICLLLANAVPAFWLAGDMAWGWMASLLEFLALLQPGLEAGQRLAAIMGVTANLGYLITIIAHQTNRLPFAKTSSTIAALAAFASVTFLATGSEKFLPGPGCLLWVLTGVLLVRATR